MEHQLRILYLETSVSGKHGNGLLIINPMSTVNQGNHRAGAYRGDHKWLQKGQQESPGEVV